MLPLELFVNAALFCLVSIFAVPASSRVLDPAGLPHKEQLLSQVGVTRSAPNANPSLYSIQCFEYIPGLNLATLVEDCTALINDLIIRGDESLQKRSFSRHRYSNKNVPRLPARWTVGQCSIYFEAAENVSIDRSALVGVAHTANKILSLCMKSDSRGSGGEISNGPHGGSFRIGMQGHLESTNFEKIKDSEIPILPDLRVVKQALDAKVTTRRLTIIQRRGLNSRPASISLIQPSSWLNSTGNLETVIAHDIDCFERGMRLRNAVVSDCMFIINEMILRLNDPFRVQTWGYTDDEENNLSDPDYDWNHQGCYIRVKNIDEEEIDKFRPVDVAEQAQRIIQKCVTENKEGKGGHADIGHLGIMRSFYVVVSGTLATSSPSLASSNVLSLPFDKPRTLESRAYLEPPQESAISEIVAGRLEAGESYPVHCFDPEFSHRIPPAILSDCDVIINDVIPRLPNPMLEQSFGYTDAEDINLSIRKNGLWAYGQCVVFVKSLTMDDRDRFRYVDVASTAKRILDTCVEGSKYAKGGTAGIGTMKDHFYVSVGGLTPRTRGNGTVLIVASDEVVSSPSDPRPSPTSLHSHSRTESAELDKRSDDITERTLTAIELGPSVRCFRSGIFTARKIDIQDCNNAAMAILQDPKIFVPQPFTTEPTGGIRMPLVYHNRSCYLMMDTSLDLSVSDSIPLLKVVYWALEIMLKCITGREDGFGGASRLDGDKRIFVSVTSVDPTFMGKGLAKVTDENLSL